MISVRVCSCTIESFINCQWNFIMLWRRKRAQIF